MSIWRSLLVELPVPPKPIRRLPAHDPERETSEDERIDRARLEGWAEVQLHEGLTIEIPGRWRSNQGELKGSSNLEKARERVADATRKPDVAHGGPSAREKSKAVLRNLEVVCDDGRGLQHDLERPDPIRRVAPPSAALAFASCPNRHCCCRCSGWGPVCGTGHRRPRRYRARKSTRSRISRVFPPVWSEESNTRDRQRKVTFGSILSAGGRNPGEVRMPRAAPWRKSKRRSIIHDHRPNGACAGH